jgi:hypothetical protein
VCLDDQVAAGVRDMGPLSSADAFLLIWGPCQGYPHTECQHQYSYSQVYGSLGRLAKRGLVARDRAAAGSRAAYMWRWIGPPLRPMPPWAMTEEERWEPS